MTHQNETTTENVWNASESRDSWEQASWEEADACEYDQFEGSFADEDEEEAFNLAGEALASERNTRRTVAPARAIMHDIKSSPGVFHPQGANKKGSEAGQGKGKGQGKYRNGRGRTLGQSSNSMTRQAEMSFYKSMPAPVKPCLKCGSRAQKVHGTSHELHSMVSGFK